jgi:biopolymer transport protein ExbD
MALRVGAADDDEPIAAINTTPLVDVMLVLLIIFLITIPVVTASIPVALPQERIEARATKPENVVVSVDAGGSIHWHDQRVDADALVERLKQVSAQRPQPEVQIRGDRAARYEGIGRVLAACQRAGIAKVSFIMEPPARGG